MTVSDIANAVVVAIESFKKKGEASRIEKIKNKMAEVKYPSQVASIKRTKKVLGIDEKLTAPTERERMSPMELHSGFSRFEFTIVDKENGVTPTANIPAEDIYYVLETSRIALQQLMIGNKVSYSGGAVSVAYTQKLIDKNFKGLTPAEVLLKDAKQVDALLNAKKWLETNIDRYPANKSQINAIDEAIALLNKGELKPNVATSSISNIQIYKTDYKFKMKQNEKGYNLIYGIEISCDVQKNYPFSIEIMNCYAPVETGPNGQKSIKMNMAENLVKSSMIVTREEWIKTINKISRVLDMFEASHFDELLEESEIATQMHFTRNTK